MFNRKDDLTKELEQYYADREDHSSHSVLQEIQEAESYKNRSYSRNYDISPKNNGRGKSIAVTALVVSFIVIIATFAIVLGLIFSFADTKTPEPEPDSSVEPRTEITDDYFYFDSYLPEGDNKNVYISDFMNALLASDMSENIKERTFSNEYSYICTEVDNGSLHMHSTIYLEDYRETYQGEAAEWLMEIQKITGSMACPTTVDVFYNDYLFTFDSEEMAEDFGIYSQEDFETILYD